MSGREASADQCRAWLLRARALRQEQRLIEADAAIAEACAASPKDPLAAFLRAQSRYELGHPAADLFAGVRGLWPDNRDALRNHALALASEGEDSRAIAVLDHALAQEPGWLDGQRVLASLRWTLDVDDLPFDSGYAAAVAREPGNQGLWLAWFAALAQIRDWTGARDVLDRAVAVLGETDPLLIAATFLAAEAGEDDKARMGFARLALVHDAVLDLARLRFHLRQREIAAAEEIALALLKGPSATQAWSYLSIIWRLKGDSRWAWLDGDPPYAALVDVGFSERELEDLAAALRALHRAGRPYAEQTVRGGTQTDRSVLLRHEPIFQDARRRLLDAVAGFVGTLPPHDPQHPSLGRPREGLQVSGSWSVRLGAGGYNVAHTHPMGWLSSAFYITVPDDGDACPAPEGYLQIGAPPPELGLDLEPYALLRPEPGKLAIFPSTMWHGTIPFSAGERLNIAFDIVPVASPAG